MVIRQEYGHSTSYSTFLPHLITLQSPSLRSNADTRHLQLILPSSTTDVNPAFQASGDIANVVAGVALALTGPVSAIVNPPPPPPAAPQAQEGSFSSVTMNNGDVITKTNGEPGSRTEINEEDISDGDSDNASGSTSSTAFGEATSKTREQVEAEKAAEESNKAPAAGVVPGARPPPAPPANMVFSPISVGLSAQPASTGTVISFGSEGQGGETAYLESVAALFGTP